MTDETPNGSEHRSAERQRGGRPGTAEAGQPDLIVGVAAAGAGIESLRLFFAQVPKESGLAFVVVLRQAEAANQDALWEAVAGPGALAVSTAADRMPVEANAAYLAPPNAIVTIRNGRLHIRDARQGPGDRAVIDSFLISLAEDQGEKAVAAIFADTGTDGTVSVAALKEQGGLTIAEETPTLGAAAASPAAMADFLLPPERMVPCILQHRDRLGHPSFDKAVQEDIAGELARIATILRNKTGHDFHGYKKNTFLRRVQRRMQVTGADSVRSYAELLRDDTDEVHNLFNDLLIGVTHFFRDLKEFELLEREVIPKLFEGKSAQDHVRVWVLGCATGEEAYSLAILLREHSAKLDVVPHMQIFATDIDVRALAAARVGRYTPAAVRDLAPERLARWFVKEGNTYCVAKELREMCLFSAHNVIRDAPFSRLELISCRNLLIYLESDLQDRLFPLFHFALNPGAYLFLGNSENVTRYHKLFTPIDRRSRIFRRVDGAARRLPDMPINMGDRRRVEPAQPRPRVHEGNVARQAERIADRYAPAYVVVDRANDVLHFSGGTGPYLDPPGGAASLNLLSLVHRDLRIDLRSALSVAAAEARKVEINRLSVRGDGGRRVVDVVVEPFDSGSQGPGAFVVLFRDHGIVAEADLTLDASSQLAQDEHFQRLDQELRITRERLQATIEELETTNEELKSSNEEYQSLNEELQSSNEELETSKEELQSVNEELQTVNGELAHRVQELAHANSDLKNLLESTQIATMFLDNDLRIKNFTPAITDIFHLIETDLGRPISHIASRIAYPDLETDAQKVLRTLSRVEREIRTPRDSSHYLVRILPYRSIGNVIEGVVITFSDVTPVVRAEEALRESERRMRLLVEGIPQMVWRALPGGQWVWASPQWTAHTGQQELESRDLGWLDKVHPEDRQKALAAWAEAGVGQPLEVEYRIWRAADRRYRSFQTRAMPARDESGQIVEWLGTSTDVDEMRTLQEHQRLLVAELQHRVRNMLAVIRSIARRTAATSESVEDYANHLDGRLDALSRTQATVTRRPGAGVDLGELVSEELLAHAARDDEQVRMSGPEIRLQPKAAELVGLAIHELATNAVKYGALSSPNGHIDVAWSVDETDSAPLLRIEWVETGVPAAPRAPKRQGFGHELIERTLSYELGAHTDLRFEPSGLRCRVDMPLTDRIAVGRSEGGVRSGPVGPRSDDRSGNRP